MKYRKKPVVVEAFQTDKELDIETLEGTMHASVGDYIITGVRGEQYPCKPNIFEQTYEPADTPASPWHRVKDELPPPNKTVLVCKIWGDVNGEPHKVITMDSFTISPSDSVIAWMPLPEPPKEDA